MHAGGLPVEDLHAVHAAIAFAGGRVIREDQREGDEAPAIVGPAVQNRKLVSEKSLRRMTSLQGPSFTVLGNAVDISASFGSIFSLSTNPSGFCIWR